MVPPEEEARACNVSPGSSSLHSPEPAVLARCPRCPSCRTMRAAGACGVAKRATTYAWGKQPHTELNHAPAGDSATSAEPSTHVERTSADATAPARPECQCPSWTLRGHPREPRMLFRGIRARRRLWIASSAVALCIWMMHPTTPRWTHEVHKAAVAGTHDSRRLSRAASRHQATTP